MSIRSTMYIDMLSQDPLYHDNVAITRLVNYCCISYLLLLNLKHMNAL